MGTPRESHAATLLQNGKVLVAGVFNEHDRYLSSAEIYDPASGSWSPTGGMSSARIRFSATLLPDGEVLAAGGSGRADADVYDPASGIWNPIGSMTTVRFAPTATLVGTGDLVVGGSGVSGEALASAEIGR